ncbi:MAG: glycosyltransferase [Parvularcula sp.]|jgi:glycosyltransferase involved in cell wall biosynthesis|nr:glycosyltransferase [Parvularcula sp.]
MGSSRKPHIVSLVLNKVEGDGRVLKSAQAAMAAGYNATVVGVAESSEVEHREFDGVRVLRLPNAGKRLGAHGVWGGDRTTRDLRLLVGIYGRALVPELIKLEPDLIHSHDMIGLKLGAIATRTMATTGRKVPWIHDLHEYVAGLRGDLAEAYMPVCLEWERAYLHRADHLVTVSDPLAQIVGSRYGVAAPEVIYNTPRLGDFADEGPNIRDAIGLDRNIPLVVFVGGANELRGCHTIIDAIGRLADVHLAFVSEGTYVEGLVERARSEGFGDRVHLHPYVPVTEVTRFVRTADVGIHGMIHYPNGEVAMPNKMFEYLHGGLPLVVSDVAGMKGFVDSYKIGLVFAAGDVTSCASAIRRVIDDRSTFVANITKELKRKFSWEAQEQKIVDLYQKLLSQRDTSLPFECRQLALEEQHLQDLFVDASYGRAIAEASFRLAKSQAAASSRLAKSQAEASSRLAESQNVSTTKRFKSLKVAVDAGLRSQELAFTKLASSQSTWKQVNELAQRFDTLEKKVDFISASLQRQEDRYYRSTTFRLRHILSRSPLGGLLRRLTSNS